MTKFGSPTLLNCKFVLLMAGAESYAHNKEKGELLKREKKNAERIFNTALFYFDQSRDQTFLTFTAILTNCKCDPLKNKHTRKIYGCI